MNYPDPLISVDELKSRLNSEMIRIIDTRFSLEDPEWGRKEWKKSRIPGALYAHLDDDLSGPVIKGATGRHPKPGHEQLANRFSFWGIEDSTEVVVYDNGPGAYAARLWWLLRYSGHRSVRVLDGGWAAWINAGGKTDAEPVTVQPAQNNVRDIAEMEASTAEVENRLEMGAGRLLDARAFARFRGETEPLDPVAGHIPGARCAPFTENLTEDGFFLPADQLRTRFESLLDGVSPNETICYCGSGVTAAHNILAMHIAGLAGARLYVGSWSEWITDPDRPIGTGP